MNVIVRDDPKFGKGVYAARDFNVDEEILHFQGERVPADLVPKGKDGEFYLQIGPLLYMGPSGKPDDFVNHSCSPNAWIDENGYILRAALPVKADEHITFDYSIWCLEEDWVMHCRCGSNNCRGKIGCWKTIPNHIQKLYLEADIVPAFINN